MSLLATTAVVTHRRTPVPLTDDNIPALGQLVGYVGLVYHGEDYLRHDYNTGPLVVTDVTPDGFYAVTVSAPLTPGGLDVFVAVHDGGKLTGFQSEVPA
jgi:hypothetical protein